MDLNKKIKKFFVEAYTGLEPVPADYETAVLPLN